MSRIYEPNTDGVHYWENGPHTRKYIKLRLMKFSSMHVVLDTFSFRVGNVRVFCKDACVAVMDFR